VTIIAHHYYPFTVFRTGSGAFSSVNLTGTTRFRLRFQLDDNDDMGAANQPVLVIEYYAP